jgi:hypothetical protein
VRYVVFAILALVPMSLVGWIVWHGQQTPVVAAASASAGHKSHGGGADAALRAFFDGAPGGAKTKDKAALYDEKGLFDYIDGAAPIFIERHFRKLAAAEMATAEGSDLTCDIYDMNAPENAQSIFDKEKSPTAKPVPDWPEAIMGPMSFVFSNGRYYVKLTAFDKKAEAALPELAKALRERMK